MLFWLKDMKNIWPHTDMHVIEDCNIWIAFSDNQEYCFLIVYSHATSNRAVWDLKPYQWIFYTQYIKIHVYLAHGADVLPTHDWLFGKYCFTNLCRSNVNTFYYIKSKNHICLKNIMLNKQSQTQKAMYCMIFWKRQKL